MTQSDGWFDFMVNGGGAVGIQFGKSPFRPKEKNVFVPWNEVRDAGVSWFFSRNLEDSMPLMIKILYEHEMKVTA